MNATVAFSAELRQGHWNFYFFVRYPCVTSPKLSQTRESSFAWILLMPVFGIFTLRFAFPKSSKLLCFEYPPCSGRFCVVRFIQSGRGHGKKVPFLIKFLGAVSFWTFMPEVEIQFSVFRHYAPPQCKTRENTHNILIIEILRLLHFTPTFAR